MQLARHSATVLRFAFACCVVALSSTSDAGCANAQDETRFASAADRYERARTAVELGGAQVKIEGKTRTVLLAQLQDELRSSQLRVDELSRKIRESKDAALLTSLFEQRRGEHVWFAQRVEAEIESGKSHSFRGLLEEAEDASRADAGAAPTAEEQELLWRYYQNAAAHPEPPR